jgi:hypothetical protein
MLDTPKLNRRHKAVLFITPLAVGVALIAGAGIEIAAGIGFVGAALAWAIGSNSRIVHVAFVAVGLLLFCGGLISDWRDYRSEVRHYQRQVAEFEKKIPDLADCYSLLPAPTADWFAEIGAGNVNAAGAAKSPQDEQFPDLQVGLLTLNVLREFWKEKQEKLESPAKLLAVSLSLMSGQSCPQHRPLRPLHQPTFE